MKSIKQQKHRTSNLIKMNSQVLNPNTIIIAIFDGITRLQFSKTPIISRDVPANVICCTVPIRVGNQI